MKTHLNSGLGVRQWDPAFREFREHYGDLEMQIQNIKNGVAVSVTGSTPGAIAAARNHASVISKFVKNGSSEIVNVDRQDVSGPAVSKTSKLFISKMQFLKMISPKGLRCFLSVKVLLHEIEGPQSPKFDQHPAFSQKTIN